MRDFKEDSLYPQYAICKKHKIQKWKKKYSRTKCMVNQTENKGDSIFFPHAQAP